MATGRMRNGVFVEYTADEQAAWDASRPSAADDLARDHAAAATAVKIEAQRRIFARLPAWKQSNLQARELELTAIVQGLHPVIVQRSLTTEEHDERVAAAAEWEWARSVRAASNAIEEDIAALADGAAVAAWLSALPADPRWPA